MLGRLQEMLFNPENEVLENRIEKFNEAREKKERGFFYFRYTDAKSLSVLLNGGDIKFDGPSAFQRIMGDKRFNFNNEIPESNILSFHFLRSLYQYVIKKDVRVSLEKLLSKDMQWEDGMPAFVEDLKQIDQQFANVPNLIRTAILERNTDVLVKFFKAVGGDELMVQLKRSGWDMWPDGAFSDLVPLSVGAPLALPGLNNELVVIECQCASEDIIVPEKDYLNEHEVMAREIGNDDITYIYSGKSREKLWKTLKTRFLDFFKYENPELLAQFGSAVPLEELMSKVPEP